MLSLPGKPPREPNVFERAPQIAQHSPLTPRDLELPCSGEGFSRTATLHPSVMDTNLTMRQMETRFVELVLAEEEGSIEEN